MLKRKRKKRTRTLGHNYLLGTVFCTTHVGRVGGKWGAGGQTRHNARCSSHVTETTHIASTRSTLSVPSGPWARGPVQLYRASSAAELSANALPPPGAAGPAPPLLPPGAPDDCGKRKLVPRPRDCCSVCANIS